MKSAAAIVLLSVSDIAFASSFQCPNEIQTRQESTTQDGWVAFKSQDRNFLTGARFSLGHPSGLMIQTAVDYKENEMTSEHIYRFDPKGRSVWVVCDYNATSITLTRKIGNASECKVLKNKTDGNVRLACNP